MVVEDGMGGRRIGRRRLPQLLAEAQSQAAMRILNRRIHSAPADGGM